MEGQDFVDDFDEKQGSNNTDSKTDDSDSDLDLEEVDGDEEDDMEIDEETEGDVVRLQRKYPKPNRKEIDRTERVIEEEKEDEGWEIEVARVYSRVLELIGGEIGGDSIGIVVEE